METRSHGSHIYETVSDWTYVCRKRVTRVLYLWSHTGLIIVEAGLHRSCACGNRFTLVSCLWTQDHVGRMFVEIGSHGSYVNGNKVTLALVASV